MLIFLYNIGIFLYTALLYFASNFNSKARLMISGRENWQKELKNAFRNNTSKVAWFHVASLGEFEQGRTVIELFKKKFPKHKILLTFFSPSGYEIRKNYQHADNIFYLPLDTKSNAKRFVSIVEPSLAIFILPGGALLLPLVVKFIPKLLPSAFDDNRIEDEEE